MTEKTSFREKAIADKIGSGLDQAFDTLGIAPEMRGTLREEVAKLLVQRSQGIETASQQESNLIPLPEVAPERWKFRADKTETPHNFIKRVYAEWLPGGNGEPIGRGIIGKLDPSLYKQLREIEKTPKGLELSTDLEIAPNMPRKRRSKTTTEEIENFKDGIKPENFRDYNRVAAAVRRQREAGEDGSFEIGF